MREILKLLKLVVLIEETNNIKELIAINIRRKELIASFKCK